MAYWAATRLEANRERVAQFFLEQAGYEVYLPKVRWRTRGRRTRISPLFPGYLFTRIELQWRGISCLPGVIKPVMSGDEPVHVPRGPASRSLTFPECLPAARTLWDFCHSGKMLLGRLPCVRTGSRAIYTKLFLVNIGR